MAKTRSARRSTGTSRSRAPRKRPIKPEDLLSLKFVRAGRLSPDGSIYIFPVQSARRDRKGYDCRLYMVKTTDGSLRQLTFGKKSDGPPVLSPDGKLAAFVAKRGKHPGIHILPTDGGEARPLVEKDGEFSDLSFSPDGRQILCTFRPSDPRDDQGADKQDKQSKTHKEKDDDKPEKKEPPVFRHITRLFYRLDGQGFLPKEEAHVWIFDVESGEGRQLTKGKRGCEQPAFSPNGKQIAYVSNIQPDPDVEMDMNDLFVISAKGGKARRIPTPKGMTHRPSFSPDGATLAYLGHDDAKDPWFENTRVWVVPVKGRGKARCLCPDFDQPAYDGTISDMGGGFFDLQPQWSPDGRWIHFISCSHGSSALYRVSTRGGSPQQLTPNRMHLQAVDLSADRTAAAGVVSTELMPPEVFVFDLKKKTKRRLTHLTKEWTEGLELSKPEKIRVKSTEDTAVDAWILKPPKFSKNKKYPAIVEAHGGPMTQYGYSFFHEMQFLAAKGYVVYYSNPRGSLGYGRAFSEAIKHDWGGRDYADVAAGTDHLESLPYVDPKRIGITGGSYGGYMTNWAVGHTQRYKAAVTQRSVVDMIPFFGSSDVGYTFHHEIGGHPWENVEGYRRQSPLTYAKNIRTPLLIIHSENDLRCNIEQAENLFATLKVLKRTTEFVRFPEEPHGLSRGGRPDRRIVRLEKIADWFEKYL
ncbi:MAG: prolyl oligopeptidase family serine peptidase [Candidatus Eisenbacteria bacterium]|nr:prolyl oligopeptidase family serine peptidase [Candidatus Eisenbacteria bacterium]